ncbi:Nramp family divalent metal transporter [Halorarum halophilum]|uniref:Nramp family divalent metal transporter n=1 Tax=Halorarum halophilum TaxID=2743090 RepID=A0A7D5KKF4_9EURY|nr:Nramp family divalent metal transporter [Halobaculum halophilum]QLG26635.1 Nramp family divalent metal transporter [Halobaculum halophilum]
MTTDDIESDGGVAGARDEVFASDDEGVQYRDTVYRDIDYDSLETAPETADYPKTDGEGRYKIANLPKVPKVSHIVGPSAIMLGASLGSGETIFWPTLVATNGWGLYWAFWVGVITQFFINTEIQRWTLATGESIFRAFERMSSFWPWFFLAAGFAHVGWPGWAAGAAEVGAAAVGIPRGNWPMIGIALMILIWLSYQAGPIVYNMVEKAQVALMFIAIFGAVVLIFIVGSVGQLANVPAGAVNFGALPADMNIAVFLGGLAYAGAGGYINLAQGVWAREKGYGMATYQGRILNPLQSGGEIEEVHESGMVFEPTTTNMRRWRGWWKIVQQEHFLTFVVGLLVVATVAMTITAEYAPGTTEGAIDMWLDQVIPAVGGVSGALLYVVLFIALFSTQYAILEAFVRNSVDIIFEMYGRGAGWDLNKVFIGLLTIFTLWGIAIIGLQLEQPFILLVIGAAIAGVMMWPYNALVTILNATRLPEHTQPGWGRVIAMWWATGFFGFFSVLLIGDTAVQYLGADFMATTVGVVGSSPGGYVLWLFALVVQVYTMYRSAQGKLASSDTVDNADEATGLLS